MNTHVTRCDADCCQPTLPHIRQHLAYKTGTGWLVKPFSYHQRLSYDRLQATHSVDHKVQSSHIEAFWRANPCQIAIRCDKASTSFPTETGSGHAEMPATLVLERSRALYYCQEAGCLDYTIPYILCSDVHPVQIHLTSTQTDRWPTNQTHITHDESSTDCRPRVG